MLRVYQRQGGGKFSWLTARWFVRRTFYAWLPIKIRVKLRQLINF
jgi:hypothetical protein